MGLLLMLLALVAVPLGVSWLLTALLIRWAPRLGLVDHPDPRKVHLRPTPRAGGLAIAAGVAAGALLLPLFGQGDALADPRWLFGPAIIALGLADDWRPLPWWLRLGVQTAVTAVAVCTGLPAGDAGPPAWLVRALAVVWTVGLVNAFNMLDNMDLLSGGTAWVGSACLALAALLGGGPAPGPAPPVADALGSLGPSLILL